MAVAAPETIRSTPVVTFTVPEMMTPSAPVSGVTGTGQPGMADGADSTATGTPADAPTRLADTSLEPWLQPADAMPGEAAPSEPPEGNVAPVQMAAIVFNGDTSILPVADAVPDEEPGATHSAAPALGADGAVQDQPRDAEPIQLAALEAPASQPQSGADAVMPEPVMTATVSLPADALALTEQMRREAAAREAARIAAIDAAEARQAAAARAAREAQARERQLAEQRARETRQREMAEQQARALRERQLAERREREEAAAAEAENQRRMAALRGNSGVQIGAYRSERDARDALREGSRFAPSFARGEVSRVETSDGVFFRARFTGLAASAARALCGQITSGGGTKQCLILGN
jgi:colicin import membrane protein